MRINKALFLAVALPVLFGAAASHAQDNSGGAACLADFDGNGRVDFPDFVALAGVFGTGAGEASYNRRMDLDGSGRVDFPDFVAFAGVFGTPCVSRPVAIPDSKLRAVIADNLGKAHDAPITRADMAGLTSLIATHENIRDMTGIEFAINLERLDLSRNELTGAIPPELGSLTNLKRLDLSFNALTGAIPPEMGRLINLVDLNLYGNELTGATPPELGSLTNLRLLSLYENELTGAIPRELGSLTNLESLYLRGNALTGAIPPELGRLINLVDLNLYVNELTGAIPRELGSLTNLEKLGLASNELTGAIPPELGSLTNLTWLDLSFNALTGAIPPELGSLTNLKRLALDGNTDLSDEHDVLALLRGAGITVYFEGIRESDFDIELVFLDVFTDKEKRILNYAARRWTWLITRDVPDNEFIEGWSGRCGDQPYEIPAGERIDDLRIYVTTTNDDRDAGWGGPHVLRSETFLPVLGCMAFNLKYPELFILGLHEIAHVLGFGTIWEQLGFLQDPEGDAHFNGPLAIDAFNEAGGWDYAGAKVPLNDTAHWKNPLLDGELMGPSGGGWLSAITVQSLADLGYGVDVTQADAYTLPGALAGAKIAGAAHKHYTGELREPVYVVDPQGRILDQKR